ncbi:MAG: HAD hydrolase-like protein [Methanobacterium sp.]|nr:HAD hydrolase-like protein [Methanobacterium sp.]
MDRLVLLDIDKTLLMGSIFHYTALKAALSQVYGIKNPCYVHNMQGMTDLKIICETLTMEKLDLNTIKSGLNECMELMYLNLKTVLQNNDLLVLDGVKPLLETLQKHEIPMGLVTGNIESMVWLKLEKVGLNKYFQFGGFGDKVIKRRNLVKDAITESEKYIGKINYKNIFLVGDTPRDIVAGQKLGVKTIAVATGDFTIEEINNTGADFILNNLKETKKVLNIILNQ